MIYLRLLLDIVLSVSFFTTGCVRAGVPSDEAIELDFTSRALQLTEDKIELSILITRSVQYAFSSGDLGNVTQFDRFAGLAELENGYYLVLRLSDEDPRKVATILLTRSPQRVGSFPMHRIHAPPPAYVPFIPGYRHLASEQMAGDAYIGLWRPLNGGGLPMLVAFSGARNRCGLEKEWLLVTRLTSLPTAISVPMTAHGDVWSLADVRPSPDGFTITDYEWRSPPELHALAYPCARAGADGR